MIARVRILLPYALSVPVGHELSSYEREIDGQKVHLYPHYK